MAIQYEIDKKNQTVTAKFTGCRFDAVRKINKALRQGHCEIVIDWEFDSKYLMASTYSATVKCHAPDIFDVETGRQLAKEKLKSHYMAAMNWRLEQFREELKIADEKIIENKFIGY